MAILNARDGGFQLFVQHLGSSSDLIRRWMCLAIGKLWDSFPRAKSEAVKSGVPDKLIPLLKDSAPYVRCAAVSALGALFGDRYDVPDGINRDRMDLELGYKVASRVGDGSPAVRTEIAIALGNVVYSQIDMFVLVSDYANANRNKAHAISMRSLKGRAVLIWRSLLTLCRDPVPAVGTIAVAVKRYVKYKALCNAQLVQMINPRGSFDTGMLAGSTGSDLSEPSSLASSVGGSLMLSAGSSAVSASSHSQTALSAMQASQAAQQGSTGRKEPPRGSLVMGMRHFDRYKMRHMRPGGSRPSMEAANINGNNLNPEVSSDASTNASPSQEHDKSSYAAQTSGIDNGNNAVSEAESRMNDPLWTVYFI